MKLKEHLSKLDSVILFGKDRIFDKVVFSDLGFLSIQASGIHHCTPCNVLDDIDDYEDVEIMYTGPVDLLDSRILERSVDESMLKDETTYVFNEVYSHVPVELVEELLDRLNENYTLVYGCEEFKKFKERYLNVEKGGN